MAARMSWLWKRKCIRTWTDEIFHYPAKDQSLESTWIPTRKSFYFLNWMYFHFWSGSKSPSRASRLIRNALFLLLYAIIEAWIEHDNTRNVYYESKWCSFRFHVDFRALSWFCETKTLAKSVSESKRRAFFCVRQLKRMRWLTVFEGAARVSISSWVTHTLPDGYVGGPGDESDRKGKQC